MTPMIFRCKQLSSFSIKKKASGNLIRNLNPLVIWVARDECELNHNRLWNLHKAEWKRVQALSDIFWSRWRKEYLQTLQNRRKWQNSRPNLRNGDVVLLKDSTVCRNQWPLGQIVNCITSADGLVRKVEVRVVRAGKPVVYTRPVTEVVCLVSCV